MLLPWGRCPAPGATARYQHGYSDINGNCQPDRLNHPNLITDCDKHRNRFGHTHVEPDAYHHAHTLYPTHAHLHGLAHGDLETNVYAAAHGNTDTYVNTIAHRNTHTNVNTITHRNTYTNSDTLPHAMTDIVPFLKSLISAPGLSAHEGPVARMVEEKWRPLVDEISLSRLGSVQALKRGKGEVKQPSLPDLPPKSLGMLRDPQIKRRFGEGDVKRPSIMIATHMDAIGLMVTQIVDGFLHVTKIGGIDARILPGTPVVVHGKQELPGVVVLPPLKTLPAEARDEAIGLRHLLVDVGLLPAKTESLVRVGDLVSFNTQPADLAGEALSGHSLDNRASIAALTVCLEELLTKAHLWNVWAVATAQEEETLGGAATSAFDLQPDLAVVIDVTFAKGPGANGWETFPMGKGPTLGWGANLHPFLYEKLKALADKLEIPVAMEVMPTHSGTDAYAIQVAGEGVPTMLLGIPLRYMHTPVEVIAVKDVQRAGRLLAEFISGLEADFVAKIVWDEGPQSQETLHSVSNL